MEKLGKFLMKLGDDAFFEAIDINDYTIFAAEEENDLSPESDIVLLPNPVDSEVKPQFAIDNNLNDIIDVYFTYTKPQFAIDNNLNEIIDVYFAKEAVDAALYMKPNITEEELVSFVLDYLSDIYPDLSENSEE